MPTATAGSQKSDDGALGLRHLQAQRGTARAARFLTHSLQNSGASFTPKQFNEPSYQHNFQAARSFKVGPYHRPHGWVTHHWVFGQILPRAYWGPEYILADYWLFALEVPPPGYEWVRDDTDALLVSTDSGEILQVEYGVFG